VDVITKSPPNQDSPLMHHVQSPVILEQLLDHVFSDVRDLIADFR
jgi:hypothetical protein